jgi:ribosomal protein L3
MDLSQGNSKGKRLSGGVKRHNFSMQDATHGSFRYLTVPLVQLVKITR